MKIIIKIYGILNYSLSIIRKYGVVHYGRLVRKKIHTRLLHYPLSIIIETSSKCNFNCSICWAVRAGRYRRNTFLSFNNFKKIINDIRSFCYQINLSFCGEPLLNRDICKMIEYAGNKGIDVIISTNGQLLNPTYVEDILTTPLKRIIISLDAVNESTYKKIRRGGRLP